MDISNDIRYAGVNDHEVDLFEGQYAVKNGMSYNSYVIMDEKIAVMDTVDARFTHEWLDNIEAATGSRKPDYLIIQHMEPDHSANIANFMNVYKDTKIVSSAKAFVMMKLRHRFRGPPDHCCRRRHTQSRQTRAGFCHRSYGTLAGGYRHLRQL